MSHASSCDYEILGAVVDALLRSEHFMSTISSELQVDQEVMSLYESSIRTHEALYLRGDDGHYLRGEEARVAYRDQFTG